MAVDSESVTLLAHALGILKKVDTLGDCGDAGLAGPGLCALRRVERDDDMSLAVERDG